MHKNAVAMGEIGRVKGAASQLQRRTCRYPWRRIGSGSDFDSFVLGCEFLQDRLSQALRGAVRGLQNHPAILDGEFDSITGRHSQVFAHCLRYCELALRTEFRWRLRTTKPESYPNRPYSGLRFLRARRFIPLLRAGLRLLLAASDPASRAVPRRSGNRPFHNRHRKSPVSQGRRACRCR